MGKISVLVKPRIQTNVRILVAFAAAFVVLFANTHPVSAVENTANTLKVTPVRTDIEVKPGESKTVEVTVTNLTGGDISVRPIENDFIAGDEKGTPSLILDADKSAPTHSLKKFMVPLSDVTIPAKESKTIEVVISVPKGTQAGGYFGAVRFAPTTPDSGGQVNLSASVASLILLTVPGDLVEKLDLTNFSILQNGKSGTFFQDSKNIEATFRFENQGNVQVGPFGKISVQSGNKVIYSKDFNDKTPRDVILPDSARRWNIPLEKISGFGYYTVSATLTYGAKNQTVEVSRSFWVIPWSLIISVAVGLVVLIALIVGGRLFLRSYKKRVLKNNSGFRN